MKNNILLAVLLVAGWNAQAFVDRKVVITGKLTTLEEKIATIETEAGPVRVTSESVRAMQYHPGQNVLVYVDISDLVSLNIEKFKKAGLLAEQGPQEKKSNRPTDSETHK